MGGTVCGANKELENIFRPYILRNRRLTKRVKVVADSASHNLPGRKEIKQNKMFYGLLMNRLLQRLGKLVWAGR